MVAGVGLVGVVAGALIAFAEQYAMPRRKRQERLDALLLEQFALIVACTGLLS